MGVMLNRSGLKNLGPEKLGPERLGPERQAIAFTLCFDIWFFDGNRSRIWKRKESEINDCHRS